MELKIVSQSKCFGGEVQFLSHVSTATKTEMRFSVFLPSAAKRSKVPVLYWLSGLTCTEENFMAKSGIQQLAEEAGMCVVAPDTSPRKTGIAGEDKDWDFGTGAGFYLNALREPWSKHFRMEEYCVFELVDIVENNFPVLPNVRGVSGHSMGGHGALVLSLRHPGRYRSVSAFSPISAPSVCPWGQKAFQNYLGDDVAVWHEHDASQLVKRATHRIPFLVDQGSGDKFLNEQLMPERLLDACRNADYPIELNMREGYDHSYYFVSTFLPNHIRHHQKAFSI